MGIKIEVFSKTELLFGAYPDGNVHVVMDMPVLDQVKRELKNQLTYIERLTIVKSTASTEVESDECSQEN